MHAVGETHTSILFLNTRLFKDISAEKGDTYTCSWKLRLDIWTSFRTILKYLWGHRGGISIWIRIFFLFIRFVRMLPHLYLVSCYHIVIMTQGVPQILTHFVFGLLWIVRLSNSTILTILQVPACICVFSFVSACFTVYQDWLFLLRIFSLC